MNKSVSRMKKQLVTHIEDHLGWGSGNTWTNKDFNELSEQILKVTGKQLSVTTLKRVWGRAEKVANTSVATFDILSEFLGYTSWRDYQQKYQGTRERWGLQHIAARFWKFGIGALVLVFLVIFFWQGKERTNVQPIEKTKFLDEAISFSFDKVSSGYPNTVIFKYDVGDYSFDTLCIQQSWDRTKRIYLNESKGLVTSTYYQPGYFLAKLVGNGVILKERDLYIPTKGWQGMLLGGSNRKTYLKPEEIVYRESLKIDLKVLEEMQRLESGHLYLANLFPDPMINGNDFTLSTKFRMPNPKDKSICRNIRMTVTGTREVISLEFSIPGCVGDLMFFIDKEMVSGRNHDFSAFGKDVSQWIDCELSVKDKALKVFLEGEEVFSKALDVDLGKIGGVQWYFNGLGEISKLHLEDGIHAVNLLPEKAL